MVGDDESREKTKQIVRAVEGAMERLKETTSFTDEEIGLALLASGLNSLNNVWTGDRLVAHLANLTAAVADHPRIDPQMASRVLEGSRIKRTH